jgi:mono/diheme cytochrome c family protein
MAHRKLVAALGLAGTLVLGGCALMKAASRPAPDVKVAGTPEQVARGKYLANNLNACLSCHSPLTEVHLPQPGKEGSGGRLFGREDGLPGNIYSTNLTPDVETGIGGWTDGEVIRAIREGVSKDGHALFPLMPYPNYAKMSDEDVEAIVAYLRTLKPVKNKVGKTEIDFPLNIIVNTIPKPLAGPVGPAPKDGVARGEHVLNMASCAECHTPREKGKPVEGMFLAGGHEFKDGDHTFKMPNLTSDKETGLGGWTDAQIERAVRFGERPDGKRLSPVMPWAAYSGMAKEDMKALVAYLRTVPPVKTGAEKK